MKLFFIYWKDMINYALRGSVGYYFWIGGLAGTFLIGLFFYYDQLVSGLSVSNMSNQVSWGIYIGNFTYLVGIAAAAVLVAYPSYIYHREDIKKVVLLAELMAVSAIVMCLMYIIVDLGRPDRMLHIIPFIGRLNFPGSILAWDVVVLSIYLVLNLHIPGYLLYQKYLGKEPKNNYYKPLVFVAIVWAVSIHTVTAFLYSGLGGRPFWNSAILAPRFIVSAFACGPAAMIIIFSVLRRCKIVEIQDKIIEYLLSILKYTLPLNLFLFGCEIFTEVYTDSTHAISVSYLFFGIHGHGKLIFFSWSGILLTLISLSLLYWPKLKNQNNLLIGVCLMVMIGIWFEKGLGLVVPAFIPSPAGDLVEYLPSVHETFISLGILAFGLLVFTIFAKVASAIQSGKLSLSLSEDRQTSFSVNQSEEPAV